MPLVALALAAGLAASPGAQGPVATSRSFHDLVQSRPAEACRRYLTAEARRQWDREVQTVTCRRRRAVPVDPPDRFRYRLLARPSARVARVERALIDESAICMVGDRKLYLARSHTLARSDGRWRIARFTLDSGCVP